MDVIKIVWDIHFDRHQNCVNKVANHCKFMIIKIAQEVVEYLRSWSKLLRTKMLERPSRCQQPPTQPSSTEPALWGKLIQGRYVFPSPNCQHFQRAFRFFCLLWFDFISRSPSFYSHSLVSPASSNVWLTAQLLEELPQALLVHLTKERIKRDLLCQGIYS